MVARSADNCRLKLIINSFPKKSRTSDKKNSDKKEPPSENKSARKSRKSKREKGSNNSKRSSRSKREEKVSDQLELSRTDYISERSKD